MKKNKKLGSLLLFAMLIVVMVSTWYSVENPEFLNDFFGNAGVPDAPDQEDVDLNGDNVPDVKLSFSTFQALRIVYSGGDKWIYPQSRTSLTQTIIDYGTSKTISTVQSYIYCTVNSDMKVTKVVYSASATMTVYKEDKKTVFKSIATMPISKTLTSIFNEEDKYIASASMTASDFQGLLVPSGVNLNEVLYYNVKLSSIQAKLTFENGETTTMSLTGVQGTTNQLWWKFKLLQSGTVMEIVNLNSVEWIWE